MKIDIDKFEILKNEIQKLGWIFEDDKTSNHIDSQMQTWQYYNKIYKLNIPITKGGKQNVKLTHMSETHEFSGDTDFTFKKNNKKFKLLKKKLLSLETNDKEIVEKSQCVLQKLELCSILHHSLVNFSIMPILYDTTKKSSTLNRKKGTLRFDKYLRTIANYYETENYSSILGWDISLTSDNFQKYFDDFNNKDESLSTIYLYCSEVYGISKDIVDIILSTNQSNRDFYTCGYWRKNEDIYDHLCLMEDYMDVAYLYWNCRKEYISSILKYKN